MQEPNQQGRFLDLTHDAAPERGDRNPRDRSSELGTGSRPFLGIQFECCGVYGRIYRFDPEPGSQGVSVYRGHCPKCGAKVVVPVGEGGTARRFFKAQ
ncbi:MAG: hypothetical protein AAGD07_18940 [Planctomycetota bacterium]